MLNKDKTHLHYAMIPVALAFVFALLWLYHHGYLNWFGLDGPKAMSPAAEKKFAKYVGTVAVTAQNNLPSGKVDAPTALPVPSSFAG